MAVNYANLFEDLGVLIRGINELRGSATGLPASLSGTITAATQANPIVVTSNGHGMSTGDRIRIDSVAGMVEINDLDFLVEVVNANTFSLYNATTRAAINSSAYTAYSSAGTWVRYKPRPNLAELMADVNTVLADNDSEDVLSGIPQIFERFRDTLSSFASQLAGEAAERLTDRDTILEQLVGIGNETSVEAVLAELYRDMITATETIKRCTVTLGSVTADGTNDGTGTVQLDKVLDGTTPPANGFASILEYSGSDSELAVKSETMVLTCIQDEDTDGVPEGEEVFMWEGSPPNLSGPFDWRTEGSGTNKAIPVLNTHQIISNKDFEAWNANVPESWDLDSGVAGDNVVQEGTGADVFRGDYSLKLLGDGATATIKISQTLPSRILIPKKRYCLAVQVKGDATIAAGSLTIQFESPSGGYTAGGTEQIVMNAAALAAQTTYGLESFYFTIPSSIPDDLELVIKVTGTLTDNAVIHIDSLAFGPVDYANGISAVIVAGPVQFIRGDRFTFPITNDEAGIIQTFFRKQFKVQLPSSATPSRKDLLAS